MQNKSLNSTYTALSFELKTLSSPGVANPQHILTICSSVKNKVLTSK